MNDKEWNVVFLCIACVVIVFGCGFYLGVHAVPPIAACPW